MTHAAVAGRCTRVMAVVPDSSGGVSAGTVEQNRVPYNVKAGAMLVCLLADVVLNATADFDDQPRIDRWFPMVLIGFVHPSYGPRSARLRTNPTFAWLVSLAIC